MVLTLSSLWREWFYGLLWSAITINPSLPIFTAESDIHFAFVTTDMAEISCLLLLPFFILHSVCPPHSWHLMGHSRRRGISLGTLMLHKCMKRWEKLILYGYKMASLGLHRSPNKGWLLTRDHATLWDLSIEINEAMNLDGKDCIFSFTNYYNLAHPSNRSESNTPQLLQHYPWLFHPRIHARFYTSL